jgi:hypothetical protein
VVSCDGKGIVMRADARRPATAAAAKRAASKLTTRLSRGEQPNRKRIAEVGAVYEIKPAPRTPQEVLASTQEKTLPAPKAKKRKWLCASVVCDAATVVRQVFDEAEQRDGDHERTWVALVEANNHQIDPIKTEATNRGIEVTIVVDLIHVVEYLWSAAWASLTRAIPLPNDGSRASPSPSLKARQASSRPPSAAKPPARDSTPPSASRLTAAPTT